MIPLGIAGAWSTADELGDLMAGGADAGWGCRTGWALVLFAVARNVPFLLLASTFEGLDRPRLSGGGGIGSASCRSSA